MKIRWQALKGRGEAPLLVMDLVVLLLISLDLLWLLVDALLLQAGVGVLIGKYFPGFLADYARHGHARLLVYDFYFTLFLVLELALRWSIAVVRRSYHRWFFYPFANWYDVLGIIPLPFFRALRLLRLISILYRLQQLQVVDLAQSRLFELALRYYRMVVEEISDRVVINVLDGVQREISSGGPLTHRVGDEILNPQRGVIVPWLADLIADTGAHAYGLHRENLARYLDNLIRDAIAINPDLQKLKRRLLFAGPTLEDELQRIIAGLLTQALDQALSDLGERGNAAARDVAGGLFDTLVAPHEQRDEALRQILLSALELIKAQVRVQQWKLDEQARRLDIP